MTQSKFEIKCLTSKTLYDIVYKPHTVGLLSARKIVYTI